MSESSQITTSNGHEIDHPREKLTFEEFKDVLIEYGLNGSNSTERVESLRNMGPESIALLMTDINRRAQGSEHTLIHEKTMKIGDKELIPPEERYELFTSVVDKIHQSPESLNPERIGDALALTTVLLHPFKDGNGRTSRLLGFVFRDDFDAEDAKESFETLVEPRDKARERGGFMINGYVPYFEEGVDRADPKIVENYIDAILTSDDRLYTGPYGQAELKAMPKANQVQAAAS